MEEQEWDEGMESPNEDDERDDLLEIECPKGCGLQRAQFSHTAGRADPTDVYKLACSHYAI